MLIPTKYEKLNQNVMVIGASIIGLLRKGKYSIEELHQAVKRENKVNLERFYGVLAFLWITEIIDCDDFYIFLKKQNVS